MSSTFLPKLNKYYRWYTNITKRAQDRNWTRKTGKQHCGYVEIHHIVPKSLGGNNSQENLVYLTAREHFICHLILTKFLDGDSKHKMIHALWRLCNGNKGVDCISSRKYENIRRMFSLAMSQRLITDEYRNKLSMAHSGTKNHFFGKKHTPETKLKITKTKTGRSTSTEYHKNKIKEIASKEWLCINITTKETTTITNLAEYCRLNRFKIKSVRASINRNRPFKKTLKFQSVF